MFEVQLVRVHRDFQTVNSRPVRDRNRGAFKSDLGRVQRIAIDRVDRLAPVPRIGYFFIGCIVAVAMPHLDTLLVDLDVKRVVLTVLLLIDWIEADGVGNLVVFHDGVHGRNQVVGGVDGFAARPAREQQHGVDAGIR